MALYKTDIKQRRRSLEEVFDFLRIEFHNGIDLEGNEEHSPCFPLIMKYFTPPPPHRSLTICIIIIKSGHTEQYIVDGGSITVRDMWMEPHIRLFRDTVMPGFMLMFDQTDHLWCQNTQKLKISLKQTDHITHPIYMYDILGYLITVCKLVS